MRYPDDLKYNVEHTWLRLEDALSGRVGITDFAQAQLKEVVFVELPEVGDRVEYMEPFGVIESVKATNDLYSPATGVITEVNPVLSEDPGLVNRDPYGDGWMIVGDSGMFVNAVHREGSNLAMTTGRLAAETVISLKQAGKEMTQPNLSVYRAKLDDSFVMKDLAKYKDMPGVFHANPQFFTTYPELVNRAAHTMLTVDGVDKKTKEREIFRSFTSSRSLAGLVGDAFKMWRALR